MISPQDSFSQAEGLAGHISYQGQLLIAMPALNDQPFNHSVIYLCQHDAEHAMGLVLNQPINGLNFSQMMKELGIESHNPIFARRLATQKIYRGGPVQNDRGFVLHTLDYQLSDVTLDLGGPFISRPDGEEQGVGLTASRDILVDLSGGTGPARSLIALGYAGWGPGQLEAEISQNAWLVAPASQELLFGGDPEHLWSRALASMGIDAGHLSGTAGTA
ncbi:MAG: YqgE/AlgH family protein [Asticcacaulis sp.]|uniref:YqgE/AlgH family protein n=1 Tax=Asticcacaulis sp. TaxID=1872648 RepID=UPI0039E46986